VTASAGFEMPEREAVDVAATRLAIRFLALALPLVMETWLWLALMPFVARACY
jgi:hypothetical protein